MNAVQDPQGSVFSREDTQVAKGIAILCMMFHHMVPNNSALPLFMQEDATVFSMLGAAGKFCVSLLTILSGFGLAQVYRKRRKTVLSDMKFVASHMLQLLSIYWPINAAVALILYLICCTGYQFSKYVGTRDMLLGLTGIYRFVGGWFLTAIILLYLAFPLCYRLVKRFGLWFLAFSWLPWILYFVNLFSPIRGFQDDSVLLYLFSFSLGIYLSVKGKLKVERSDEGSIKYYLLFIAALLLRILFSLPFDVLVSLSILLLVAKTKLFSGRAMPVLAALGRESANIWLIHISVLSILYHFMPKTLFFYFPKFILLVVISYLSAKAVTLVKAKTGYASLISRIRKAIEA